MIKDNGNIHLIAMMLLVIFILGSCASSTMISSTVDNTKLYVDGQYVGSAPYKHRDTKIVGTVLDLRFEKEGYKTLYTTISKDEELHVGALIGGLFFYIPFLWIMKYKSHYMFEMEKASGGDVE